MLSTIEAGSITKILLSLPCYLLKLVLVVNTAFRKESPVSTPLGTAIKSRAANQTSQTAVPVIKRIELFRTKPIAESVEAMSLIRMAMKKIRILGVGET